MDLLHPAARLALVRVVGLLREKAESQLVQSLDENFQVVPGPAHGFGGHRRRVGVVAFLTDGFAKSNQLFPDRNMLARQIPVQEFWHSELPISIAQRRARVSLAENSVR